MSSNNQLHYYIFSYDIDSSSSGDVSKNLLRHLRSLSASPITKSTWIIASHKQCEDLCSDLRDYFESCDLFPWGNLSSNDCRHRYILAEITGKVFWEYPICDDDENWDDSLDTLLNNPENSTVFDGFKSYLL